MKFRERLKRAKDIIVCPRCGNKCLKSQERCNECGLIFSRLKYASNKVAKRQLMHFNRDFVVYTKELPSDVKRWKLILYVCLLGLLGGHHFYVGKYGKGIMMCLGFVYWISSTILNPILADYMETNYLYIPIAIYGAAWVVSLVFILSKKYKVPVLIDESKMQDEVLSKKADFDRTKQEIIAERKKLEEQKADEKNDSETSQNNRSQNNKTAKNKNTKNNNAKNKNNKKSRKKGGK